MKVANSPLHADAVGIAFNPFNAHDLLVTYTPEGTLSDNPGAAIHAIERAWDKLITTVKNLNVKTAGVAPGSVTAAAWSPNNTVCLGTDGGVLLVCSPHDGQVLAPPGEVTHRVNECFDAGEAKPAGHGHAWAATPATRADRRHRVHEATRGARGSRRFVFRRFVYRRRGPEVPRAPERESRSRFSIARF
jgi:hypothetical protein